jgi:hypothetical protein
MASALRLRILLFEELPGTWVARALEHDIATEARRMEIALRNTLGIIAAHVDFDRRHGRLPLSAFPPAPQRFWNAFTRGTPMRITPADVPLDASIDHARILVAVAHERPSLALGREQELRRHAEKSAARDAVSHPHARPPHHR